MRRPGPLLLALVGLVLAVGGVVLWFALDGFQLGAYGGLTAEQREEADRATTIATPIVVIGLVLLVTGLVMAAVRAARARTDDGPSDQP